MHAGRMPKRNMLILALLPVTILVVPTSPWSQRLGVAATMTAAIVLTLLLMHWARRPSGR